MTYALLSLCALVLVFGVVLERRPGVRLERARRFAWVFQVAAFVAAYFVLRPGAMPRDPAEALRVASASHQPVFVDLYSNY